jgi:hypothetical protein
MGALSRRQACQALAAVSLARTQVQAQPAKPGFCGGGAIEWANDVARSAIDRLGNKLVFGEPLATLDYSNDLFAISLLRLADRIGDPALRAYGEDIVGSFVADDGSIKRVPERGFRLDAMPAGVVLVDIYQRTRDEKYRKAANVMRHAQTSGPRATADAPASLRDVNGRDPGLTPIQCGSARQNARETAPTTRRLTAQIASRLNQLRDTNLSPR